MVAIQEHPAPLVAGREEYQDGPLVVRKQMANPVGCVASGFFDLRKDMEGWKAKNGSIFGWGHEAMEYAYLMKLMVSQGSTYQAEAA